MPIFFVERYLPDSAAAGLRARVADVTNSAADGPEQVRHLFSAFVPGEQTCFCLFEAVDEDAVAAVNARAGFAFDRIHEAVLLADGPPPKLEGARDA